MLHAKAIRKAFLLIWSFINKAAKVKDGMANNGLANLKLKHLWGTIKLFFKIAKSIGGV